jgi:hypothetical protein
MVAQRGGRRNSSAAWTESQRWWTTGRGVPVDHRDAWGSSYVAGGGRWRVVNGELFFSAEMDEVEPL